MDKSITDFISNKLSKDELIQILLILIKNDIKYTRNKNGIFIGLKEIPQNIIDEIETYVKSCIDNKLNKKNDDI